MIPGRPANHEFVNEQMNLLVSAMYRQGVRQDEIGRRLALEFPQKSGKPYTQQAISKRIAHVRQEWASSRIENYDAKVDLELTRIDHNEVLALRAFERSIGVHKTVTVKHVMLVDPREGEATPSFVPADEITTKSERLNGDPRYLAIALDCVRRRCELLGLDAPKKTELTGPNGSQVVDAIRIIYDAQQVPDPKPAKPKE